MLVPAMRAPNDNYVASQVLAIRTPNDMWSRNKSLSWAG